MALRPKRKKEEEPPVEQNELQDLAQILDRVIVQPAGSERIPVTEAGNYLGRIKGMEIVKKNDKIYINYFYDVIGLLKHDDEGRWICLKDNYKCMKKGYLLNSENTIKYLLNEYRAFDVRRTDGQPCVKGGDVVRSEGIPKGTICVLVVKPSKYGMFVGTIEKPRLTLEEISRLINDGEEEYAGNYEGENDEEI